MLRLTVREAPDPRWALLTSELIHHCRSALDNMVWQLVLLNGGTPTRANQFPTYKEPPADPKRGLEAMLRGMSDRHRDAILALQPYNRPATPAQLALSVLADLSNIDKHRALQPALAWGHGAAPPAVKVIPPEARGRLETAFHRGPLEDGVAVYRYRLRTDREAKVIVQGAYPIEMTFGDEGVGGDILDSVYRDVCGIVEQFAPDF